MVRDVYRNPVWFRCVIESLSARNQWMPPQPADDLGPGQALAGAPTPAGIYHPDFNCDKLLSSHRHWNHARGHAVGIKAHLQSATWIAQATSGARWHTDDAVMHPFVKGGSYRRRHFDPGWRLADRWPHCERALLRSTSLCNALVHPMHARSTCSTHLRCDSDRPSVAIKASLRMGAVIVQQVLRGAMAPPPRIWEKMPHSVGHE